LWQTSNNVQAAILDPHPGLAGWWSFNEGTGTLASDNSGNGNTGTINGATWVDGKYGKAMSFNGVSNYVDIGDTLDPQLSDFTVMSWIKTATGSSRIIDKMDWVSTWRGFFVALDSSGHLVGGVGDGSTYKSVVGNTVLTDNLWHCVAVVFDRSANAQIFVDGLPKETISISALVASNINNAAKMRAGSTPYGGNYFNGVIDEVRMYNRALSATEIQADYSIGPDFSANVLAKVPQGTTQVITTLSWQGTGNIGVTIVSPSQEYTENILPVYQKSSYSTTNGITSMLNIKRLSVSVSALPSDQNWNMVLTLDKVDNYQITVEIQK
jgi:hypothetical protein